MGSSEKYLHDIQMERYEIFKAQKPSDFDVCFEIDGKKLYADSFKLRSVSNVFKTMLPQQITVETPFLIENFYFDHFKNFITFIYSGKCAFTNGNILFMIGIAKYYNVKVFKAACEEYLLNRECVSWTLENVYTMLTCAYEYGMENLKKSLLDFVSKNLLEFIKSTKFHDLKKSMVYDIVKSNQNTVRQEELFEMVYKWAGKQAIKASIEDAVDFNVSVAAEISSVLPFFKFQLMNNEFLIKFVASKSFLFPNSKLSDILWSAQYTFCVVDQNGKMMKGVLDCLENEKIFAIIQSQKNVVFNESFKSYINIPAKLAKFTKKSFMYSMYSQWYLVYQGYSRFDGGHTFSIKPQICLRDVDFVLAGLIAENGFELKNWKFI